MGFRAIACFGLLFGTALIFGANAQVVVDQKYENKVQAARNISALTGAVFGEAVNDYSGATSFTHVDISIPGNSQLPISLGRTFSVEDKYGMNSLAGFGDWDVDVPYIMGVFASTPGWTVAAPSSPDQYKRCSTANIPYLGNSNFTVDEVWGGHQLHIPGGENGQLIKAIYSDTYPEPADGNTYPWITQSQSRLRCLAGTKNGYPGEAFALVTTSGHTYYFDWGVEVAIRGIGKHSSKTIGRKRVYLLASRIEDRFGNWVNYNYTGSKLTSITSNDGRQITLSYTGNTVTSVSSDAGSWSYQYDGNDNLSAVTLPDASRWTFAFTGNLKTAPPPSLPPLDDSEPTCDEAEAPENTYEYRVTHPSGAMGKFNFQQRRFYRTRVPRACNNTPAPASYDWLTIQNYFDSYALGSLTVTGPGLASQVTSYHYGWSNPLGFCTWAGTNCQELCLPGQGCTHVEGRWVTVTRHDGTKKKRLMGVQYGINEGRFLREQILNASGTVVSETVNSYVTDAEASAMPFSPTVGQRLVRDPLVDKVRPLRSRAITQAGVTFSYQVDTGCGGTYCYDGLARPIKETRFNTWHSRTDTTEYYDHLAKWVLGQTKKTVNVANNAGTTIGLIPSETAFSSTTALPLQSFAFGKLQQTLTYNTDGTVATVKDGNNNVTTLSSWKRGIPQSIKYPVTPESPTGATQSAVVSNAGWITSVTDDNGYKTCYGYDAMGRINLITYPSETQLGVCDASAWTPTQITFAAAGNAAAYGMPAGHWRQTTLTGNGRKILVFDALWRPIVEQTLDLGNVSGTLSEVIRRYDSEGRLAFQSYPMNTGGQANYADMTLKGAWNEYDALDRVTSVAQDSELTSTGNPSGLLITLTEYLSGFQTRVTHPKGQQTTTSYMAYDQPIYDWPKAITHPEGAFTDITRDVFGKPTALKRRNSAGSVAVTRSYAYNAYQELCRSVEPETGVTLMGYDGAGNLTWSASGLSPAAAPGCHSTGDQTSINPRKVVRTYDARNRVRTLSFSDGKGDQTWTYTPDGLPASIAVANPNVSTPITNTYTYNRRRLPVSEATKISTPTYTLSYGYNANGHLSSMTYPNTTVVGLAPNALGQPTQAGSYATGVQYYPNGALKQFTYGNGIVHTMTQNARQLPARSTDSNGALDLGYAYDKNANVSAITDYTSGGRQTRAMSYDNLDRLTQTTSAMFGTASYGYNALDNLTSLQVTGGNHARNYGYVYDGSNRLTNVTNGVGGASIIGLGYDPQGNVVNKNGQTYEFDYGNRLRRATNHEWYAYDGHGRRVLSCTPTACDYQQYGADGKLYFHQDNRNGLNYVNVYLGGSLVAIREQPTAGGSATVKYQHTDALGTPIAETDANKTIIRKSEYEPYGQLVNRPLTDGPGFTGHVQDAATGLTYMQQRYYDPQVGMFLSVDPVTAYGSDVRHFNRYAYAYNNPYKFTDPDGRAPPGCGDGTCRSADERALIDDGPITPVVPESYLVPILRFIRTVEVTGEIVRQTQRPTDRGKESEKRVLDSMGEKKNTEVSKTSEGNTIPDFKNQRQVGEIKDTQRVTDTKQLRAQREYAKETGREHTVVTGKKTKVSRTVDRESRVVRRDDLGPKR